MSEHKYKIGDKVRLRDSPGLRDCPDLIKDVGKIPGGILTIRENLLYDLFHKMKEFENCQDDWLIGGNLLELVEPVKEKKLETLNRFEILDI